MPSCDGKAGRAKPALRVKPFATLPYLPQTTSTVTSSMGGLFFFSFMYSVRRPKYTAGLISSS